jgi:hypothetical protein
MTYKQNENSKTSSNYTVVKTKLPQKKPSKFKSLNSKLGHISVNMTESYIKACSVGNSSEIDKSNMLCKLKSLQCHECHPFNNSYPISVSQFRHELSTLYFRLKVLEEKKIK